MADASALAYGLHHRDDAEAAAEREAQMFTALSEIISPFRQTLDAAVLLLQSGFDEQGEALAAPAIERIGKDLRAHDDVYAWPDSLADEQWTAKPPSPDQLLEF